jgi:transcriptional regulator with XRE-family HTH domain
MGRHKSREERLRLGGRAAELRKEGLEWKQIAERLGVCHGVHVKRYYEAYKASLLVEKSGMSLGQIEKFASEHDIERGYLWLYENGFKHRVPQEVRAEIENAKLSIFPRGEKGGPPSSLRVDKRTYRTNRTGEERARIVKLHDEHRLPFWQIGERFGISRQRAHQLYKEGSNG